MTSTPGGVEGEPRTVHGRWLACESDETGKREVFVQPFPPTGQKWQTSTSGGGSPRWVKGGRELLYFEPPVEITTGPDFHPSVPQTLFATPRPQGSAVTSNGERFLINLPGAKSAPSPMTL
ncbi:MAG TPA: hypothetical protein VLE54_05825, partial [Thermoanaerobaculia bacterium]|nr:hypothetical protein [Thermoanaerobaculia bacterium]